MTALSNNYAKNESSAVSTADETAFESPVRACAAPAVGAPWAAVAPRIHQRLSNLFVAGEIGAFEPRHY
ncbi:hypothetical protein EVAR_9553_1 [Eumeta japonica]|uniref:Uncharacterized protein n=1 Tax=Eumeta variegata TaxID=151549 RepID=A0A4C1U3V1_EUMVA|nr:hypothetical protein EVAR_9553_1 [Eumeta japonica]